MSDPPELLRHHLEVLRRQGLSFDAAWSIGMDAIRGNGTRHWKMALEQTRAAWKRAYEGSDGDPAIAALGPDLVQVS